MRKEELLKLYEEIKNKGKEPEMIFLYIHMPTGETETIINPNVKEKIEYIDRTYDDDLVHANCKQIYIEEAYIYEKYESGMLFAEAYEMMKKGAKIKLPSWGGYWYWDAEKGTIIIHTKDGEELDIRQTEVPEYTFDNIASDEWQIADEKNCPELGGVNTFSFGEAIKYVKRGMKVARIGWNGKKQYIQLATGISYKTTDNEIVNCEHETIGNMAIAFVGTSGVQMGWLASQADMLAEDWVFAESK